LTNWSKVEFVFTFKLGIPPPVLDTLEFYRVEMLLEDYEEYLKEEKKQHDEQTKEYENQKSDYKMPSAQDMYKNVPKFDGMGNMPKLDTPNFSMPKL
jgi:predicted glycosyl hydrolase (DUF1957 family)